MDKKEKNLPKEMSNSEFINHENSQRISQKLRLKKSTLLKPISLLDTKISDCVEWLQNISLIKLAAILSQSALLFAVVSYVITIPSRQKQEIQNARKVLREESGYEYSDSRIAALKVLNKGCKSNPGLKAVSANMANLTLSPCQSLSFTQGSLKVNKYSMDLSYSNLTGANLSGANLAGINLQGSNLQGANLVNANLEGANLKDVNLEGANLARANLKKAILHNSNLDNSNLYRSDLQAADFSEANLVNMKALWANFHNAIFHRANLESANFNRANLRGADFYKANLENASLRFTDFGSTTNVIEAKLNPTNFRETQLKGADLWGAKMWSIFQIKQAKNWQETNRMPNWEQQIKQARLPRLRIALLKPENADSISDTYEFGMRRAANRRVEIWGISYPGGVKNEAKIIRQLIKDGMDGIILTPEDPVQSLDALKLARDAGVAITTVNFCFNPIDAEDLAIACYNTNSFQMGYDSGQYIAEWAQKNLQSKSVQIGLVDGAVYDRYYPYLQGVLKAINHSGIPFQIVDSVSIAFGSDIIKVKKLLEDNPDVQILWGGSNIATEVTVAAVAESALKNKVKVFGILDLSRNKATKLLNPNSPLQLIIEQSSIQIGYEAVKTTISVLRKEIDGADYQVYPVKHRLLTQNDPDIVSDILNDSSLE
ncbi:MAG: pentapeptide repeat-containing protein [Trichodesmium sp. St2_bin6]|nr:pentapeptide repeat-containing protein [Trichodesmium sp. St4_bin8_1]MDE5073150.1 pentapeptide repeat-containing protein [Trichodesmium sp. St5_bin8]MDE5076765.1 pentapeptide repeat-containing protein [Trichodesmium sp. St2_bin6]MDE5091061.1 pentapeptide repeat-containing protein [Trichodesmium sp. St18_bin3_1_1]MDE5104356.1 pentapeptide repeat-containing protein [Trichodesmium sp. St19_bin2]